MAEVIEGFRSKALLHLVITTAKHSGTWRSPAMIVAYLRCPHAATYSSDDFVVLKIIFS